jgi:hypothetical protein
VTKPIFRKTTSIDLGDTTLVCMTCHYFFLSSWIYFIFVFEILQNLNDWNELDLEINFESNITLIMHGTQYKLQYKQWGNTYSLCKQTNLS